MTFILQLLFFQVIIFGALAFVLKSLMGRHATTATAHLQGLTQDYLKKQEELKRRLEDAEIQYQTTLAKSRAEVQEIKAQGLRDAEETGHKIQEDARKEADRIMSQAVQAKEMLRTEMAKEMERQAVEIACRLIREVFPKQLQESAHTRWMEEVIGNGLLHLDKLETPEKVEEARVVSAAPLTSGQREKILAKLKTEIGHTVALKEEVDPALIAGLVITLGHLVLDGSVASKLREAARRAQDLEK